MCGLFGVARTTSNKNSIESAQRSAIIVKALGINSEERGTHSSGLAFVDSNISFLQRAADANLAKSKEISFNNTYIYKDSVKFSKLELPSSASEKMLNANIILGHTRYATQGSAAVLSNASPLIAGDLIGTHNGDILKSSINLSAEAKKTANGQTDSELLYIAINAVKDSRKEMTAILRKAIGRLALVFVDRENPTKLYLVRGALSPISYAWTQDGDFVYASNPDWFRRIEKETKGAIRFENITLLPEGRLITVDTTTGVIVDVRKFTPGCRDSDLYLLRTSVYKKFIISDRDAFESISRRKVYATTIKKEWAEPVVVKGYEEEIVDADLYYDDPSLPPPLFSMAEESEIEAPELDLDNIEKLCYAMDDFDEKAYTRMISAETEEDALKVYKRLYRDVAKLYEKGLTRNGFKLEEVLNPNYI
jgi:glutamine---fructose-6-phosphate transaminase (isomerizing)